MSKPPVTPSATELDHPSLAVWENELFEYGVVQTADLRTHLAACTECECAVEALQAWRGIMRDVQDLPESDVSVMLRDRIIASREAGVRTLVPVASEDHNASETDSASPSPVVASHAWFTRPSVRVAAAVLAVIGIVGLWRKPTVAEAGILSGTMEISPALPKLGDTIRVTYTSGGLLGKPAVLRLRGRIRTIHTDSYNSDISVVSLAMLKRTEADQYIGQFVLPDSVLFSALAVEDMQSTAIDDFGGRAWEVMRAGADGRPLLAALEQRAHDLMGRSWEEGIATAREQVRLYPDSIQAWSSLAFYERAMGIHNDSTNRVHGSKAQEFSHRMSDGSLPMQHGIMFWYARGTKDSVLASVWRERLLKEAPRDEFAVQERAGQIFTAHWKSKDSTAALQELEALWPDTPRKRRAQVASVAMAFVGNSDARATSFRLWSDRLLLADSTVYRRGSLATSMASIPSLRDEAISQYTSLIASLDARKSIDRTRDRHLDETAGQFALRTMSERAVTEARFALLLARTGMASQAVSKLRALPNVGWNAELFDATATAAAMAGDTALAVPDWARLVVDPRTSTSRVARLDSLGTRYAGTQWKSLLTSTRAQMAEQVMAQARRRRVDPVRVTGFDGSTPVLQSLAKGQPMVVMFWSPLCGPAVEALPIVQALAKRLEIKGVRVVMVVEQATREAVLDAELTKAKVTIPVYLDTEKSASVAFNNWGTPQLYVLDRDGRLLFNATSSVGETELRVEALLASTATSTK